MKTQDQKDPIDWTREELRILRNLVKKGESAKHISKVLQRNIKDVREKMGEIKIKKVVTKEGKEVDISENVQEVIKVSTTREKAKKMARAARQIARANGKKITMAMFFIEDL